MTRRIIVLKKNDFIIQPIFYRGNEKIFLDFKCAMFLLPSQHTKMCRRRHKSVFRRRLTFLNSETGYQTKVKDHSLSYYLTIGKGRIGTEYLHQLYVFSALWQDSVFVYHFAFFYFHSMVHWNGINPRDDKFFSWYNYQGNDYALSIYRLWIWETRD